MKKLTSVLLAALLLLTLPLTVFAEETAKSVYAMIADLPTVEEFQAMDSEAQLEAYNRTQAAYDAYMALSEEEKEAIEGAEEKFDALFSHFNTLIAPAEEMDSSGKTGYNSPALLVIAALLATLVTLFVRSRKK